MEFSYLFIALVCLFLSALFSGLEIAFISSDKLHIQLLAKKGDNVGKILSKYVEKPSYFISTILVGNNLALVFFGTNMAFLIEPFLTANLPAIINNDFVVLLSQTLISTFVVLFTAEFLPKSIFMINPERMLTVFAYPFRVISFLMYPIVALIIALSKFMITKVFGLSYEENKPVYGLTDLNNFIKGTLSNVQKEDSVVDPKIFKNALDFKKIKVRECMIPRTEVVAISLEEDVEAANNIFIESGHSKIVLYKESIDNIIGYCHSLELFKKPSSLEEILTPILIVPEAMQANDLLVKFIDEHKSMALVVDEFGGTSGIVTVEDIIEEIFGDIQDEHDNEDLLENQINENTWELSARQEVDYINDKYGLTLPTGDYETIGGMLLTINEELPKKGDSITFDNYSVQILDMIDTRINHIKLSIHRTE